MIEAEPIITYQPLTEDGKHYIIAAVDLYPHGIQVQWGKTKIEAAEAMISMLKDLYEVMWREHVEKTTESDMEADSEWVYVATRKRIKPDGTNPQTPGDDVWLAIDGQYMPDWVKAYRAGLERGKNMATVLIQVDDETAKHNHEQTTDILARRYRAICEAAKRVKL